MVHIQFLSLKRLYVAKSLLGGLATLFCIQLRARTLKHWFRRSHREILFSKSNIFILTLSCLLDDLSLAQIVIFRLFLLLLFFSL